jgi:hypothetical protein
MHTVFAGITLLLSDAAFAQPVAGGGCTAGAHTSCVLDTVDSGAGSLRHMMPRELDASPHPNR